jgi:integrase
LIDLLAVTGMRIGEAIGLDRNDFDAICGVLTLDTSVIALWLGHENVEATQVRLHADLAIKDRALARTTDTGPQTNLAALVGIIRARHNARCTSAPARYPRRRRSHSRAPRRHRR